MQIAWAIPCRYAEVNPDSLGNLLGVGTDVMRADSVPTVVSSVLAVNVLVPEHQLGQPDTITVELLDPGMRSAVVSEVEVLLDDYEHRPETRQPSVMAIIVLQFEAPDFGQYTINLRLEDRVTSVPLFVIEDG